MNDRLPSTSMHNQNKDVVLLFSTRIIRLFCYGFLSVVLALYLVQAGLDEKQVGSHFEDCNRFFFSVPEGTVYLADFRFLPLAEGKRGDRGNTGSPLEAVMATTEHHRHPPGSGGDGARLDSQCGAAIRCGVPVQCASGWRLCGFP